MSQLNDMALKGVNPAYGFSRGPGYVVMGNDPRGTNTPAWYQSSYPWLVNTNYWNYLTGWLVNFEGTGNAARSTRIHLRNLKVFMLSRSSKRWTQVNSSEEVGGTYCPQEGNYYHCTENGQFRRESEGGVSYLPKAGHNMHGWWGGINYINGADVGAIVVTYQARLIVDGADDRHLARYLVQAGADYYAEAGVAKVMYPSVGMTRSKMLTNNWQSITFATLSDAGVQDPGGGITTAQLRANPFPMD